MGKLAAPGQAVSRIYKNPRNPLGGGGSGGWKGDHGGPPLRSVDPAYDFGLKSKLAVTGAPAATVMS